MVKNYFKITWRNLWKDKAYSFLNIAGLAIGLAGCLLTGAYLLNEVSYDRMYPNADHLYRITTENMVTGIYSAGSPHNLAPELGNDFPEILEKARIVHLWEAMAEQGNTFLPEDHVFLGDQAIFHLFDVHLLQGNPQTVFNQTNAVIITPLMAEKYFGEENPIGQTIPVRWIGKTLDLKVAGIMEAFPENSHLKVDMLGTMGLLDIVYQDLSRDVARPFYERWGNQGFITYIMTADRTNIPRLEQDILSTWERYLEDPPGTMRVHLQPVRQIHLYSQNLTQDITEHGDISNIVLSVSVSALVILIAAFNFIIFSLAEASKSLKEISVRKVFGAGRVQIMNQVLLESLVLVVLALPIAFGLVEISATPFNQLMHTTLSFDAFMNWKYALGVICITLLVGLACGGFIAIRLSRIHPLEVLRKSVVLQYSKSYMRRGLIVVQLAIFIILVSFVGGIMAQMNYVFENATLGYDKENLVSIQVNDRDFIPQYDQFKTEVMQNVNVINVTSLGGRSFPSRSGGYALYPVSNGVNRESNLLYLPTFGVGYDFIETLDIPLLMGETFTEQPRSPYDLVHLVNESAVKALNLSEPIGMVYDEGNYRHRIVGVVEDFHFNSLFEEVQPFVLYLTPNHIGQIIVRIRPGDINRTLAYLENTWKDYSTDAFSYTFVDDDLANLYQSEFRLGRMIGYSALLAIFIACLGLFGISRFTSILRTKEIGIRKMVGASVPQVVGLLSKEFLALVLVANVIAWPIAYYAMNKWLQNFAYRIDLTIFPFLLAGVMALVIALLTVSWQTLRAATANPVESLRYE